MGPQTKLQISNLECTAAGTALGQSKALSTGVSDIPPESMFTKLDMRVFIVPRYATKGGGKRG